jgi:uncharacterized protein (DUF1778 family)
MDAKLLRDLRYMAEHACPNLSTDVQFVQVSARNLLELLDALDKTTYENKRLREMKSANPSRYEIR